MASFPRWPLASGSKGDGPIGSCTSASSAKRANHPSRSRACTAARERMPSSLAVVFSAMVSPLVLIGPAGVTAPWR